MAVNPSPRLPKATLIALVKTLSGVDVFWRTDQWQAEPGTVGIEDGSQELAAIYLGVSAYAVVGIDEQRLRYDPAIDANDVLNVGQRQFTLNLRAESFDTGIEAFDLCERVRFRLRTATGQAIFSAANLSIRDVQPIVAFEQPADQRTMLVATMDIRWNYVVSADPLDPGEGGYITMVDGSPMTPGSPVVTTSLPGGM